MLIVLIVMWVVSYRNILDYLHCWIKLAYLEIGSPIHSAVLRRGLRKEESANGIKNFIRLDMEPMEREKFKQTVKEKNEKEALFSKLVKQVIKSTAG